MKSKTCWTSLTFILHVVSYWFCKPIKYFVYISILTQYVILYSVDSLPSGVTAFVAVLKTGHVQLHYMESALKQWNVSTSLLHVPISKADITVTSTGTIVVAATQQLPTYTFHTYEFDLTRAKYSM